MGQWQTFLGMPHLPGLLWHIPFVRNLYPSSVHKRVSKSRRHPQGGTLFRQSRSSHSSLGLATVGLTYGLFLGQRSSLFWKVLGRVTGRLHSVQRTLANATWLRVSWSPGYFSHYYEKISDKNNLKKEGVWGNIAYHGGEDMVVGTWGVLVTLLLGSGRRERRTQLPSSFPHFYRVWDLNAWMVLPRCKVGLSPQLEISRNSFIDMPWSVSSKWFQIQLTCQWRLTIMALLHHVSPSLRADPVSQDQNTSPILQCFLTFPSCLQPRFSGGLPWAKLTFINFEEKHSLLFSMETKV